jgi:predicted nucleic acid-binding protein
VIYLDTSVALAHLLTESPTPPTSLWSERLVSSRLLAYELWTRLHARSLGASHGEAARALLDRVALIELSETVLARALAPFPVNVRTLDSLHLATIEYLRARVPEIELATYDRRLADASRALGIALFAM